MLSARAASGAKSTGRRRSSSSPKACARREPRTAPRPSARSSSPHATLEELHLAAEARARPRAARTSTSACASPTSPPTASSPGAPWLGMKIAELGALDRVLVVGSFLRKDHPLIAHRLRQAAKRGQQVNVIHVADDDLADQARRTRLVVRPAELARRARAGRRRRVAEEKGVAVPPRRWRRSRSAMRRSAIAASLASGQERRDLPRQPRAAASARGPAARAGAGRCRSSLGARFGFLGEAANSVGGYLARLRARRGAG